MSIYSDISKRIDYNQVQKVGWPDKETALTLLRNVEKGYEQAFEVVFTIYRYAICTPETYEVQKIINEAYWIGFNNKEWK